MCDGEGCRPFTFTFIYIYYTFVARNFVFKTVAKTYHVFGMTLSRLHCKKVETNKGVKTKLYRNFTRTVGAAICIIFCSSRKSDRLALQLARVIVTIILSLVKKKDRYEMV
jgi:hypothetical protein